MRINGLFNEIENFEPDFEKYQTFGIPYKYSIPILVTAVIIGAIIGNHIVFG